VLCETSGIDSARHGNDSDEETLKKLDEIFPGGEARFAYAW
jgi:hypothetical protein